MPSAIWFSWQCLQIHLFCTPQVLFHPPQEICIVTECLCICWSYHYSTLEAFLCPVKLPDNGENEGIRIRNHIIVIKLHANKETSTGLVQNSLPKIPCQQRNKHKQCRNHFLHHPRHQNSLPKIQPLRCKNSWILSLVQHNLFNKIFFSIAHCSVGCQFLDKKKLLKKMFAQLSSWNKSWVWLTNFSWLKIKFHNFILFHW